MAINTLPSKSSKIFVALSGGVDSATSAYILVSQGYEVTGIFMKTGFTSQKDEEDIKKICQHLKIPHKIYDLEQEFKSQVLQNFYDELKKGNTPNPCVICNEKIKFGRLFKAALADGADFLATGHYAQVKPNSDKSYYLLRGKDKTKDQSYFLYRINQKQLAQVLFPVGELTKEEVRKIAAKQKLPVAIKDESQDICFMKGSSLQELLIKKFSQQKGDIKDIDTNKVVAQHQGFWNFTVGQRGGIRVGGVPKPYFVAKADPKQNTVYVAQGNDHPMLNQTEVKFKNPSWINGQPESSDKISASIRFSQTPSPCRLQNQTATFTNPVWAPTQGQSIVFYNEEKVLGGGVISD